MILSLHYIKIKIQVHILKILLNYTHKIMFNKKTEKLNIVNIMKQRERVTNNSVKYKVGLVLIAFSCFMPFFAFIIPFLGLPITVTAVISGIIIVGGPELFFIIGVFLAGKEGVQFVKKKLWKPAGKVRYMTGVVLFVICILTNWLCTYLELTNIINVSLHTQLYIMATFDILLIVSLFVMGPEFFIKFMNIFSWEGEDISDEKKPK